MSHLLDTKSNSWPDSNVIFNPGRIRCNQSISKSYLHSLQLSQTVKLQTRTSIRTFLMTPAFTYFTLYAFFSRPAILKVLTALYAHCNTFDNNRRVKNITIHLNGSSNRVRNITTHLNGRGRIRNTATGSLLTSRMFLFPGQFGTVAQPTLARPAPDHYTLNLVKTVFLFYF